MNELMACLLLSENYEVGLKCVESVLGEQVTEMYNRLFSMTVINRDELPNINMYDVWYQTKLQINQEKFSQERVNRKYCNI